MRVLGWLSGRQGEESSRRERPAPDPGVAARAGARCAAGRRYRAAGPWAGRAGKGRAGHPAAAHGPRQQPWLAGAEPCPPQRAGAAVPGRCPRPVAVQRKPAAIHPAPGRQAFIALGDCTSSGEAGIGGLRLEINLFRVKLKASREDTEFSTIATLRAAAVLIFTNVFKSPRDRS